MKIFLFVLAFLLATISYAQTKLPIEKSTIPFLLKMIGQNRTDDAIYYIQHLKLDVTNNQSDSIHFIQSYCLMHEKQFRQSLQCASLLKDTLDLKVKLIKIYDYNRLYLIDSALSIINQSKKTEILDFCKTSCLLLKKDTASCLRLLKTIKTQDTTLLKNISQNIHLCHTLPKPQKSAFVSGLLSAVVPGLGKMYVGQKKEGITAFLTVVPLGLLVFENVYKTGWNKPQTIVVSGLFSIFYIGNIFGSIYSSKAYYQNQNEKFNNEIFSNLYFPLRRVCKP